MNSPNCGREWFSPAAQYCLRCDAVLEDASDWSDTELLGADCPQSVVVGLQAQANRRAQRIYALENTSRGPASLTSPSETMDRLDVPARSYGEAAPAPTTQPDTTTLVPIDSERADTASSGRRFAAARSETIA